MVMKSRRALSAWPPRETDDALLHAALAVYFTWREWDTHQYSSVHVLLYDKDPFQIEVIDPHSQPPLERTIFTNRVRWDECPRHVLDMPSPTVSVVTMTLYWNRPVNTKGFKIFFAFQKKRKGNWHAEAEVSVGVQHFRGGIHNPQSRHCPLCTSLFSAVRTSAHRLRYANTYNTTHAKS